MLEVLATATVAASGNLQQRHERQGHSRIAHMPTTKADSAAVQDLHSELVLVQLLLVPCLLVLAPSESVVAVCEVELVGALETDAVHHAFYSS